MQESIYNTSLHNMLGVPFIVFLIFDPITNYILFTILSQKLRLVYADQTHHSSLNIDRYCLL